MRRLVTIIAAAWLLAGGAQAAPSAQDRAAIAAIETRMGPATSAQDQALAARMAELKVPGVSIAFIEDGRVKWAKAYGVAAADTGRAATPDTLFQAASMSKAVAAAAALKLVEQGRLDLDGNINGHIAAWKVPDSPFTAEQKVTLRRLLSHTAGLTVSGFPGYAVGKPVPATVAILDGVKPSNTPAVRSFEAPGGAYAYSGGGYTVAQQAIVEAGGRSFAPLLDALILKPAGMRRSTFAQPLPDGLLPRSASGHDRQGAVIAGGRNTYPEYAAAGLWTTPSDYGRFMIALQDAYAGRPRAVLRQASAQAMMTPVDPASGYGLGVVLGRRGGHPYFQHSGGNAGFRCDSFAFLDGSRQGVVVMTNGDQGGRLLGEILRAVGDAYGWGAFDPANKVAARRAAYIPPQAPK